MKFFLRTLSVFAITSICLFVFTFTAKATFVRGDPSCINIPVCVYYNDIAKSGTDVLSSGDTVPNTVNQLQVGITTHNPTKNYTPTIPINKVIILVRDSEKNYDPTDENNPFDNNSAIINYVVYNTGDCSIDLNGGTSVWTKDTSSACSTNGTSNIHFSDSIDITKLFQDSPIISGHTYEIDVYGAHSLYDTNYYTVVKGGSGENCKTIVWGDSDGNDYCDFPTTNMSLKFVVEPPNFKYVSDKAHFDWSDTTVSPDTNALLGRDVIIHIPEALNRPDSGVSDGNSDNSVTYKYAIEGYGISYTEGNCSQPDCYQTYTLPNISTIPKGVNSLDLYIFGPNSEGHYQDFVNHPGEAANLKILSISIDNAYSYILANDPDGRKENDCIYENPPSTCPFRPMPTNYPNYKPGQYIIAGSQENSKHAVLSCHGPGIYQNSNENSYICNNEDTYVACNGNPSLTSVKQNGQIEYNNIRCVKRSDIKPLSPCTHPEVSKTDGEISCAGVPTALGTLPTDPEGLVAAIFGILLSLSGAIALYLIVRAGYRIMTSEGTPEKITQGREELVSAITGLLFIIFSLVLFEIITHSFLHIPGIL